MTFSETIGIKLAGDAVKSLHDSMGHIRGKVVDINGKSLSGCRIWVRETDQYVYSDKQGNFIMINIPPALYTIVVEQNGYSICVCPDLPIEAGDNPGFRFVMHVFDVRKELFTNKNSTELYFQSPRGIRYCSQE